MSTGIKAYQSGRMMYEDFMDRR